MQVLRTYPGVNGAAWVDVIRQPSGIVTVHIVGDPEPLSPSFMMQRDAEEWITSVQDQQRAAAEQQRRADLQAVIDHAREVLDNLKAGRAD